MSGRVQDQGMATTEVTNQVRIVNPINEEVVADSAVLVGNGAFGTLLVRLPVPSDDGRPFTMATFHTEWIRDI